MISVTTRKELQAVLDENRTVVVDFYADWCGPCKVIEPTIKEISETTTVVKINVDNAAELAGEYGVRSIPTVFMLQSGDVVDSIVGASMKSIGALQRKLAAVLKADDLPRESHKDGC